MLRLLLRRTLWAIPTLFGVSLVVFFVTTLIPDPSGGTPLALGTRLGAEGRATALRREHFLDLPRFLNAKPEDVRTRAERDVQLIATEDVEAARDDLARLGGAALPYVLPELDKLSPSERNKVALALAPIAARMGLADEDAFDPKGATRFWQQFWEDRAVDFTAPSVHRAVHRYAEEGTELRARDLREVDTFAIRDLVDEILSTTDGGALARLTEMASHVTGRTSTLAPDAPVDEIRRVKGDWQEWWYVRADDYVALEGGERIAARFADTRYGKWVLRGMTGRLGVSTRDGSPILDKLERRAPVTLALAALALLTSYVLAVPLGVFSAVRRGERVDLLLAATLFALYCTPVFWVGEILARTLPPLAGPAPELVRGRFIAAALALSLAPLAVLSRYERASMLDVLRQDYIRTARAKGVPVVRTLVVHALRNALLPLVTILGLELPSLFGGALVVEEIFGLPGMGYETVRAVQAHDAPWLTAALLVLAVVSMAGLILTDVAAGALDPRLRDTMLSRSRSPLVTETVESAKPGLGWGRVKSERFAFAGAVALAVVSLMALFADVLASDLPLLCRVHGTVYVLPSIVRPPALEGETWARLHAEAGPGDWFISTPIRFGPRTPGAFRGAAPLAVPGHLLGTDLEGRDVAARLIHGAQASLGFGLVAAAGFVGAGILLGALAGFFGGLVDAVIGRLIETLTPFPPLVLVIVVQGLVAHPSIFTMLAAIGATQWTEVARIVRAEVLLVTSQDYVVAARALGAHPIRVLLRHVAPNAAAPVLVTATFGIAQVILIEASLEFLRVGGVGYVSWGQMLSEARAERWVPGLLVFPGLAIFLVIAALNAVGEALRDALDPALSRRADARSPAVMLAEGDVTASRRAEA